MTNTETYTEYGAQQHTTNTHTCRSKTKNSVKQTRNIKQNKTEKNKHNMNITTAIIEYKCNEINLTKNNHNET